MKCLSLWQPWASLIVHGHKKIETRGYPTNVRGRVAIHATKSEDRSDRDWIIYDEAFIAAFRAMKPDGIETTSGRFYDSLPRGCVVGTVELYDCLSSDMLINSAVVTEDSAEYAFGNYDMGRFGWLMRNPVPFETPIPAKGAQGWWDWTYRCPMCGYTPEDAGLHMDHHICVAKGGPEMPRLHGLFDEVDAA